MTKIAIDGPAGSGKSTVAARTAERLGLKHVDTGAMYRALTLMALLEQVSLDDGETLASLASRMKLRTEGSQVWLEGKDVSQAIRTDEVDAAVSKVAAHPRVRSVLVDMQRQLAVGGVVMEGRDIGTVVLPEADLKIYLEARPEVRAERRGKDKGSAEGIVDEIRKRDELDSSRAVSPLRPASDALVIDTSDLSADEVVDLIIEAAGR